MSLPPINSSVIDFSHKTIDVNALENHPLLLQVTHLKLDNCRDITDKILETIGTMKQLQSLSLRSSRVKGCGLVHIAHLTQLTFLNLWGTSTIDEYLKPLGTLKKLVSLNLGKTKITGKGLEYVATMENLGELVLSNNLDRIQDTALVHLEKLKHLRYLSLECCFYSNRSLSYLTVAPQLDKLILRLNTGTSGPITKKGIKEFLPTIDKYLNELNVLEYYSQKNSHKDIYSIIANYLPFPEIVYQKFDPRITHS